MADSTTLSWSIPVTAILTAIVSVLGTLIAVRSGGPASPTTPSGLVALFRETVMYIPHIILLFGILGDLFTLEGVYSIPTLIGVLSIFANWAFSFVWKGLAGLMADTQQVMSTVQTSQPASAPAVPAPVSSSTSGYDGCSIQGFGFANNPYAPQTLVVTATVFSYYIIDLLDNRGTLNSLGALIFFLVVFGAQASLLKDCGPNSWFQKILASLSEGVVFGGIGYASVKASDPTRLPSSVISPFPRKSKKDLTQGSNGTWADSNGNPYVCVGGQCFPDLSTQEARKHFAEVAAQTLGTGQPSVPASCNA